MDKSKISNGESAAPAGETCGGCPSGGCPCGEAKTSASAEANSRGDRRNDNRNERGNSRGDNAHGGNSRRQITTVVEIPPEMTHRVGVNYGFLNSKEFFATDLTDLRAGDDVAIKSARGSDHGTVFAPPISLSASARPPLAGVVQRRLTESDRNMLEHITDRRVADEKQFCIEKVRERNLPMKVVAAEHLLSGDKVIFYFVADGRVDFRELVKDLARRFRTRIEMKQIGVRDEARMLSDIEHCGRELCCRSFLSDLEPVTMRMAKIQKSTLDPGKISGHCGRLMCCMRFEDDLYQERERANSVNPPVSSNPNNAAGPTEASQIKN